jgi:hypothetical protein
VELNERVQGKSGTERESAGGFAQNIEI